MARKRVAHKWYLLKAYRVGSDVRLVFETVRKKRTFTMDFTFMDAVFLHDRLEQLIKERDDNG